MTALKSRPWVPTNCENYIQQLATMTSQSKPEAVSERIDVLIAKNKEIHERECFNLNPATNAMNPKAEAALASGLGSRPSLGYPPK